MIVGRLARNHINQQDTLILEEISDAQTKLICKVYASPDGSKVRIVLPEFENLAQPYLRLEFHTIDFDRSAKAAQERVKNRERKQRYAK